ncbi:hypothetical protein K5B43_003805 [Vibrio parahaemolyticus]|uniref:hypothetical protein n=1 Tax=Vibrio parahaemolyticus TaxID=670 RepID=UPI0003F62C33|nr:hypothetical protein [Vibrio parahaemolyticus]EHY9860508.1 hypothetical protein [Vibrio parahaemolyticus]ELB2005180.1 hypothetical protein [Vibrio parahaemolyticus]MBE3919218.1 hypothetical protein [Vibrio parahaemolyticus]MBE4190887.1 hypothetical protein [Vibrio parahaemolyticus]
MTYRITSELTISGDSEKCKALYLNIVDHFGQIDFNNIVPMPAAIRNATDYFIKEPWMMRHWGACDVFECGVPYRCFNPWKDDFPADMGDYINLLRFREACEEGTPHLEPIIFTTLNTYPKEIVFVLSDQNPGVTFDVRFYDEHFSCACGRMRICDGRVIQSKVAPHHEFMTREQCQFWENYAHQLAGLLPFEATF